MKINILLILSIFLLITNLSAQECQYVEYFPLVKSAREDYKKKDYKEARKKLKLAFSKTDFPLGGDMNLALLVAKKTKEREWAEQISIQLAKGGVPLRYFSKVKDFKWYDKFKADFNNYSNYYSKNFEPEFREELKLLLKHDREFNSKYHEWRTREIEMSLQELIDGASKILSDLKLLYSKYGIPSEKRMGYNYVRRINRVDPYWFGVLLMHQYQRGERVFKNDIHNFVCQGILHPNDEKTLKVVQGHGNNTGVEQEMKARYLIFGRPE